MGQYPGVNLFNVIDGEENSITETHVALTITFEVPIGLHCNSRIYLVIRVHGGTPTVLNNLDSDPNTVSIKTDKFSTYALTYCEETITATPTTPSGSDSSDNTSDNNTSSGDNSGNDNTTSDEGTHTPSQGSPSDGNDNPAKRTRLTRSMPRTLRKWEVKHFLILLIFQQIYHEILTVADEKGGMQGAAHRQMRS